MCFVSHSQIDSSVERMYYLAIIFAWHCFCSLHSMYRLDCQICNQFGVGTLFILEMVDSTMEFLLWNFNPPCFGQKFHGDVEHFITLNWISASHLENNQFLAFIMEKYKTHFNNKVENKGQYFDSYILFDEFCHFLEISCIFLIRIFENSTHIFSISRNHNYYNVGLIFFLISK